MKNDEFGNRMKEYEDAFKVKLDGSKPVYMRIDGRSFSRFTRSLAFEGLIVKPRDARFEDVFVQATKDTVGEFHLAMGFHQSDEVSLFFKVMENPESQLPFSGSVQKLTSVVASYFTSAFLRHFHASYGYVPEVSFDARVCEMPDAAEATNMLVWRFQDASRNLIQDIAHHRFGHKALDKVTTREKFKMIGSPELFPGNFIKRVDITGNNDTVRHMVAEVDVDFQSMSFEDRMNLIYGKASI